jgi:hypothetical protein
MSLQGIVLFVFVGASMLFAVVAIGLSAVFLVMLSRFDRMRRRPPSSRPAFVRKLLRGLSRNAFQHIGDVHHAYRVYFGIGVLRSSHLEEIGEFLERAMHRIPSAPEGPPVGPLQAQIALLRELLAANQRALEVERICVPFSGTPEMERGILGELLELPVEDKTKVTAKLDALAKAIRFRQDTLERLEEESARSLRVAWWGWCGTLVLAILVGILGFLCLGL